MWREVALVLAVAFACSVAGAIWDRRQRLKADAAEMNQLDKWATEQEARFKGAA